MEFLAATAAIRPCYYGGRRRFFSSSLSSSQYSPPNPQLSNPRAMTSTISEIPNLKPSEQRSGVNIIDPHRQAPWLLLSSSSSPSPTTVGRHRYLYELTLDKEKDKDDVLGMRLDREFKLPSTFDDHIFLGSSQGFLISIDTAPSPTIHVFNPLTGTHLAALPPPPLLDDGIYSLPDPHGVKELCQMWKTPLEFRHVDDYFLELYKSKAILSPALDYIVIHACWTNLGAVFAPLSPSPSPSWTNIHCGLWDFHDAVFHGGLLYGITDKGELDVYDVEQKKFSENQLEFVLNSMFYCEYESLPIPKSLVASPDGKDLFMVVRHECPDYHNRYNLHFRETKKCEVFRLTKRSSREKEFNEWQKVESIGDLAFFVGSKSSSFAVDVGGLNSDCYPSLRPNCVYFSDSWPSSCITPHTLLPDIVGDAGVWSMEQKKVQYIELADGDDCPLNWPIPVWYVPPTSPASV